ncbi:nicotianamine synthase [Pyxidicoccus fallax]|uniref:Nicotianamine synthase n=1 Tax=Pyxidicoccus fallax TaxID=394095 RepID=A0A848LL11_9BACT|nr:nicotianamine synthase family protein [Pyxidicoccus fallax]NMO18380.1 nicotianamine synthase [Pyxidicoccus fallax]NPC83104.1 nicotianamine synthase [Pyxidicoccus fallax]
MLPTPPNDMAVQVHRVYQRLATASSLEPCDEVNKLFSELVRISLSPLEKADAARMLADPVLDAIRENLWRVCARGEFELERQWSTRIVEAEDAWTELKRFPYYGNYEKLARLEAAALQGAASRPLERVLFVGSGPLPLTSILLAKHHGMRVDNVEMDERAFHVSRHLTERLGMTHQLSYRHADVMSCSDLGDYDCVFLAALVGMNPREKTELLRHLGACMRPGALLLARSSARLRVLLYPEVDIGRLEPFVPRMEIHPHDEVVNSVLIAEVPAASTHAAA